MVEKMSGNYVSIVVPTYEKHYRQFCTLLSSLERHCIDKSWLKLIVVIESNNKKLFSKIISASSIDITVITTEDAFSFFGVKGDPSRILASVGKFTFQSIKKIGGLLGVETPWSIILDSETVFFKDFSIRDVASDYSKGKYVFYSRTARRGAGWPNSLVDVVTAQCGDLLGLSSGARCYMELNIWLYETTKVNEWVGILRPKLTAFFKNPSPDKPIFENVLYYLFLEDRYSHEYDFIDFEIAWKEHVPEEISQRYDLAAPHISFLGADHASYTLQVKDISLIHGFYKAFNIPFLRVEPFQIDARQVVEYKRVPGVVAFVASSHLAWVNKKVAICISGDFERDRDSRFLGARGWVRNLASFFVGSECDIYLHGWRCADEAVILDGIKPVAHRFDARPFSEINPLVDQVADKLSGNKDKCCIRDELFDLYSLKEAFHLVEAGGVDYDFVVKISPELYIEPTLFDIFRGITLDGDASETSLYVPRHFNSDGINKHIAFGGIDVMRSYMNSFSIIGADDSVVYKSEESHLLGAVLESGFSVVPVDIRYASMGKIDYYSWESVRDVFSRQDAGDDWRACVDDNPPYVDATQFFFDKLKCFDFICGQSKSVADIFLYTKSSREGYGYDISSLSWRGGNPNAQFRLVVTNDRGSCPMVQPTHQDVMLTDSGIVPCGDGRRYVFFYPDDSGCYNLVEWRFIDGKFRSVRHEVSPSMVSISYWM